ncbi:hypothetical protein DFH09DRAFT_1315482 [Mycena vulgaris]|nr:hypothetical protein DFH09DRAFT_1315482 [Mycena vulgaris]
MSTILFLELAPDVILSIFACSDIFTVISIGRTCKYLSNLAFQKSVWLDLSPISSAGRYWNLVKRLIYGPDTWTPSDGGFMPEVSKEITLHPAIPNGREGLAGKNEAKLLQSGRYVFFNNWQVLECWSVTEDRLVWKHTSTIDSASVIAFAAEERVDRDSIILLICQRTFPQTGTRNNYVEIVELDVRKWTHTVLLIARSPHETYDHLFSKPAICGTLATVAITPVQDRFHIIDWKAQSSFILLCTPRSPSLISLTPQYIVLKPASTEGEDQLNFISNDVLRLGVVSTELNEPFVFTEVPESQIPKLFTYYVPPTSFSPKHSKPFGWETFEYMSVHESPLQRGTYRIWLYVSAKKPGTPLHPSAAALCSYDVAISPGHRPRWRSRPLVPTQRHMHYRGITYSGHAQVFRRKQQILPPALTAAGGEVDLGDNGVDDFVDVAAYSGALTYTTQQEIVIHYFR